MSNVNAVLGYSLVGVNNAQNQTPVNISIQGVTLGCTAFYYDQYFQVGTSVTTAQLPATTIWVAYARNLGSNVVTLTYTLSVGGTGTVPLSPVTNGFGGVWAIFETTESGAGITAVTLQATGSITPVELAFGY